MFERSMLYSSYSPSSVYFRMAVIVFWPLQYLVSSARASEHRAPSQRSVSRPEIQHDHHCSTDKEEKKKNQNNNQIVTMTISVRKSIVIVMAIVRAVVKVIERQE